MPRPADRYPSDRRRDHRVASRSARRASSTASSPGSTSPTRLLDLAEDQLAAAPRAGEVPRDLLHRPRRVLPGARRRAEGPGRRRRSDAARPTAAPPAEQLATIREQVLELVERHACDLLRRQLLPGARRRPGVDIVDCDALDDARPSRAARRLRARDLPGAHAARGRPRPPLPLHLEPLAQPRGARRGSRHGRAALRPGEGAAAAAALRPARRRRSASSRSSR